jgi:ABC-type branched-subunit amino acid transport system permease subunit
MPLSEISRATLGGGRFVGLHSMIYGLALMIVVIFLPGGVIKHFSRLSETLKKKFNRKGA